MTVMQLPNSNIRRLAKAYYIAKSNLLEAGFADEIDWQYMVSFENLTEEVFLRETAWVILSSGMDEGVIRQKFPLVSDAFFFWKSSKMIVEYEEVCQSNALQHFNHSGKIRAIISTAHHIDKQCFSNVLSALINGGLKYLQSFPFIGPITSYHLAKNIGFSCAKPDRHLSRIAERLGYDCVQKLCSDIADVTNEPVPVVDLILWRYATLNRDYLERFVELINTLGSYSANRVQSPV